MKMGSTVSLLSLTAALANVSTYGAAVFTANITTGQEVTAPILTSSITGDPRPTPFGTAVLTLNDAQTQLSLTATIFNIDVGGQTADLNDDLLNAHIHAPASPGANAGVRWGFFGSPDNNIPLLDYVLTPFGTGVGGTITSTWDAPEGNGGTTLALQLPNILGGLSYINFHTRQNMGGEIRGQIIPTPDGGSTALLLSGSVLALATLGSRRRT